MLVIDNYKKIEENTVVALGNFDGIHKGHIEILKRGKKKAVELGYKFVVVTFDDKLTEKKSYGSSGNIMSFTQKFELIRSLGAEILYILKFDSELKNMSREEFIEEFLINRLNSKVIYIGFNFKFGKNAEGDVSYLKKAKLPFYVEVVEPIKYNGKLISSTLIRDYIKCGKIDEANKLLAVPYTISGLIVRGKGRGKKLGFATANLQSDDKYLPPKFGVYETETKLNGQIYKSLTNVGENPTFGDISSFSIETHILGFDEDIYGEKIDVEFVRFIRDEVKFTTVSNLVEQVKSDISVIESQSSDC